MIQWGDILNEENRIPSNKELKEATIIALKQLGGTAKTREINKKIVEILEIPEEVEQLEHPDGLCTLLDYRLRWVRTGLKGKIKNVSRGVWSLTE